MNAPSKITIKPIATRSDFERQDLHLYLFLLEENKAAPHPKIIMLDQIRAFPALFQHFWHIVESQLLQTFSARASLLPRQSAHVPIIYCRMELVVKHFIFLRHNHPN